MPAKPDGVSVLIARRQGGGQEQAARALCAALSQKTAAPVELVALDEALPQAGPFARLAASGARRVSVNALYGLAGFLPSGRLRRTVVVFQGMAFLLIPRLKSLGRRVVAISDAPPRRQPGLMGLRERAMFRALAMADAVARTFDFELPGVRGPVIPNLLPDFPDAPKAFASGPIRELLYVGRLSGEKGLPTFLRLAAGQGGLRFTVYGAGPLEGMVRRAALANPRLRFEGYSRSWLGRGDEGVALFGCCPAEACWTAGKEALLHGVPVIFTPSLTGGPEAYAALTDKAVRLRDQTPEALMAAVRELDRAIASDPAPVTRLWEDNRPDRLAEALAQLCLGAA